MKSVCSDHAVVKKDKFRDVVGTDKWRVNNLLDDKYKPRSADEVVKEAHESVGAQRTYRLFRGNCEHFVNDLRYGVAESRQVRRAAQVAEGADWGVLAAGLVGLALSLFRAMRSSS